MQETVTNIITLLARWAPSLLFRVSKGYYLIKLEAFYMNGGLCEPQFLWLLRCRHDPPCSLELAVAILRRGVGSEVLAIARRRISKKLYK
jgi:hypothetical protein